jgi:GTPase
MFKDKVRAKFKGGHGGSGKVSFYAGLKPSGGVGGDGGDVYLEGAMNVYDLGFINMDFLFDADNGVIGGAGNLKGAKGKDRIIKVPLTTKVYDLEGNLKIVVDQPGVKKLIARGGLGGLGNHHYRTQGLSNLRSYQEGDDGQEFAYVLELELYSDIIFIGFPNAGKSSILNSLTNSESKVASYAFTTLNPMLGRMDGITLMDLPGLIEGTFEGKGLGTNFVKHTKASRLVAHMVSLESENVEADYLKMREELNRIDPDLGTKPELIILTKSDLTKPESVEEKIKIMQKHGKVYTCSVYDYDSLEALKTIFKEELPA